MGHTRMMYLCITLLIALATLTCGESGNRLGDGSADITSTASCPNGVDQSTDFSSAVPLSAGKEVRGYICPKNDYDYYKITVPAGKKMLRVQLKHTVSNTNLDLTYMLYSAAKQPVGKASPWSGTGIRRFDDYFCTPAAGTYYIVVQDDASDEWDGKNDYILSWTSAADSDTHEPNDKASQATQTSSGAVKKGYISCAGDKDYFKVAVSAGKLLDVSLTNAGPTKVDLRYTIYDQTGKQIAQEIFPDGTKGKAKLGHIHATSGAGNYHVVVDDDKSNDSDPKTPYTLIVKVVNEPDPNEKGVRNDLIKNATTIGTVSCSGTLTKTFTGAIASKADVDYYKLNLGSCSPYMVMEVSVTYGGNSVVDPQVGFIYPSPTTTCTQDSCCRVTDKTCQDFTDCLGVTTSCVTKGDSYCNNSKCEKSPSLSCATEKRCAGAVVCLPSGKCGVEQTQRYDKDGSKGGAAIKTAQILLHPGPWYVRVTDRQNDDYAYNQKYTLTIKVRPDPDGTKEMNNQYWTETVAASFGINTYEYHAKKAKATITPGTNISGYLSYEGDQDWFKFPWPCGAASECTLKVTLNYTGSGCPVGNADTDGDKLIDNGLELVWGIHDSKGKAKSTGPKSPKTNQNVSYGNPSQCLLARKNENYILSVTDLAHNGWSWTCGYSFTVSKVADGCGAPCKIYSGQCYDPD